MLPSTPAESAHAVVNPLGETISLFHPADHTVQSVEVSFEPNSVSRPVGTLPCSVYTTTALSHCFCCFVFLADVKVETLPLFGFMEERETLGDLRIIGQPIVVDVSECQYAGSYNIRWNLDLADCCLDELELPGLNVSAFYPVDQ